MKLSTAHVLKDAELHLRLDRQAVPGWDTLERIAWKVRNAGASDFHGVVRLEAPFPESFRVPWIMVPGFFYGENRKAESTARKEAYPRFDPAADPPRLMTSSHWDMAADRTAYPLVYAYKKKCCFAFASRPHVTWNGGVTSEDWEPQVGIGFGCNGETGYARLSFPACEEPFTYAMSTQSGPTIRRAIVPPGAEISGEVFLFRFKGIRHDYRKVLEFYYREVGREHPCAELDEPLRLMRDAVHGIVNWHYNERRQYFVYSRCYDRVAEQIANHKGVTLEWHQMNTGFVSGFPVCWGLSVAGRRLNDRRARAVARTVADRICRKGLSPSGLFWADYRPGLIEERNGRFKNPLCPDGKDRWGSGWWPEPQCVHARTIADACFSLAQLILHEQREEPAGDFTLWKHALRRNVETILDMQLPNGSYGAVYNAVRRAVSREAGCGGLLWIPALLKSAEVFAEDSSLVGRLEASVRRAADAYAAAVEDEYIWGAPEDNDSPTSEDGMNAVMAYGDLYRRFDERRYLDLMTTAADWMLTFRKCTNGQFHSRTLIGAYGLRSKGGDFASASNNHLHVFEVMATSHLFELSRWTGNDYYRQRALEHWAFAQQMLCRVDGQFNGFRGGLAEQFYWTNWSSFGQDTRALEADGFKGNWDPGPHHRQKGNLAGFSTLWCVNIILLGADMILQEQERQGETMTSTPNSQRPTPKSDKI